MITAGFADGPQEDVLDSMRRWGRFWVWLLPIWGVLLTLLMTSGFAVAAFFQPAIGRAFQNGHRAYSPAINRDVYGPELVATIGAGLMLFIASAALLGRAATHSGLAPTWAGHMFALAVPAFVVAGFTVAVFSR